MPGGKREGAGRKPGDINLRTKTLNKRFQDIIDDAIFDEVVQALLSIVRNGDKDADRVRAAIYLIDRAAGKVAEEVNVNTHSATIADLLKGGETMDE